MAKEKRKPQQEEPAEEGRRSKQALLFQLALVIEGVTTVLPTVISSKPASQTARELVQQTLAMTLAEDAKYNVLIMSLQ